MRFRAIQCCCSELLTQYPKFQTASSDLVTLSNPTRPMTYPSHGLTIDQWCSMPALPLRSVSSIKSRICGLASLSGFIHGIALITSGQVSSKASMISETWDIDAGLRTSPSSIWIDDVALLDMFLWGWLRRISPAVVTLWLRTKFFPGICNILIPWMCFTC